jgi:hypothetical protein
MTDYRDHHATIFLPREVAGSIEASRREWDPVMASRIAAHVTHVYPQEARNAALAVREIAVTAFDGVMWASRGRYALTGRQGR